MIVLRVLLSLLLLFHCAFSADVTFAWDPSPGADHYFLTLSDGRVITATETQVTVSLAAGSYTATVRAADASNVSDPSNTVTFRVVVLTLQTSPDLTHWTDGQTFSDVTTDPQKFYRLTIQ